MTVLGAVFVAVVCVAMPVLAIRAARGLARSPCKPSVQDVLLSTLITHGVVGVLALFAARSSGISLFPPPSFTSVDLFAGILFLALAMLANIWHWRATSEAGRAELSWLRPRTPGDFAAWAGVSLLAGVMEEIIYRGALMGIMHQAMDAYWPALGVCVAAFALGHWAQGRAAMVIIVLFAAGFHLLVRITGDLYTAVAVHVVYDFAAGVLLWALGRRPPAPL